ncbi:unnamed protein product [Brassica oleracea var. botrytis]
MSLFAAPVAQDDARHSTFDSLRLECTHPWLRPRSSCQSPTLQSGPTL